MQFEVVEERMSRDFGAAIRSDGTLLALFSTPWRLRNTVRDHPELLLEDLAGGGPIDEVRY